MTLKLQIPSQGVHGVRPHWVSVLCLQVTAAFCALRRSFSVCAYVCPNSFLEGHQSQGVRTHPCISSLPHFFFTLWSSGRFASSSCIEGEWGHRPDHYNVMSDLQVCLRVKKAWIQGLRPEPPASLNTLLQRQLSSPGYSEVSIY